MSDAPERIYITGAGDRDTTPYPPHDQYLRGTWTSIDFSAGRRPAYVRADLYDALQAENKRLRGELETEKIGNAMARSFLRSR